MYFESWKYIFLRRSLASLARAVYVHFLSVHLGVLPPPPPNTKKLATLLLEVDVFGHRGGRVLLLQCSHFKAYHANEKSNTHNFFHGTRYSNRPIPRLLKISNSFEIRVNIFKILHNKQTRNFLTTYPKAGASCYALYNTLALAVWPCQTWYNVNMCLWGSVGVCVCHLVCLCVVLFICALNV